MGRILACFSLSLLVACGTGDVTPSESTATPTDVGVGTPTETATPTVVPNSAPRAVIGELTVEEFAVEVPVSGFDADGDLLDFALLYSVGGSLYQEATIRQGSDNYLQVPPAEVRTLYWDASLDLFGGEDPDTQYDGVLLRVIPYDGEDFGTYASSSAFEYPSDAFFDDDGGGGGDDDTPIPGDISEEGGQVGILFEENRGEFDLNEDGDRDNRDEEYLLIVANMTESVNGTYTTGVYFVGENSAVPDITPSPVPTPTPEETPAPTPTPDETSRMAMAAASKPMGRTWSRAHVSYQKRHPIVPSTEKQVNLEPGLGTVDQFHVLNSLNTDSYKTVLAVLGATEDSVNIWVDQDIPIDWDYNCDGVINPEDGDEFDQFGRHTYGFDSCDLDIIAQTFSNNIITNLHNSFGVESDLDGNGAISVLITPVLNSLLSTNDDLADNDEVVEVMIYPEVDLADFDITSNPGSNEQEIFYLSAPDPAGFFNPGAGGGGEAEIETYLTLTMAANIARATQSLISFNNHVVLQGDDAEKEDEWLDRALGTLAADVCGFGAQIYPDLFEALATTQLRPMASLEENDYTAPMGYLFLRYLLDRFGVEFLQDLMDSGTVGRTNLSNTLSTASNGSVDLETAVLDFAQNLYLQGRLDSNGDPLVDPDLIPPFLRATTIPIDTQEYKGAEGYQQGINVFGANTYRARIGDELVTVGEWGLVGSDWAHFAPGILFSTYLPGGLSFHAVRIGGLVQVETTMAVVSEADLGLRLVRLPDPPKDERTFITEQIFGALSTQPMDLPLREDGWHSVAIGEIDQSEEILPGDTDGFVIINDTDLYRLDLSGEEEAVVPLEILAMRHVGEDGTADLSKISVTVVPFGDVPNAENVDANMCGDESNPVTYPNNYPEYMTYQTVMPSYVADTYEKSEGSLTEECDTDGDGLLDSEELRPSGIISLVATWQEEALGGTSSISTGSFYPFDATYGQFVNPDALDEDELPYQYPELGINTKNAESGEDGFLRLALPGGEAENVYLIIVTGLGESGPYELAVRRLSNEEL